MWSSPLALRESEQKGVVRAVGILGASRAWVVGLAIGKNVLAAYLFGTSADMDVYFIAQVIPDLAQYMAVTGLFNFIPLYAKARAERGEAGAIETAGRISTLWMGLLLAGVIVAYVTIPLSMRVVAPGFEGLTRVKAESYTRRLLGMALAVGTARILNALLVARKEFGITSMGEVSFQASSLAYVLIFHDWGVISLVWGMIFGGFVQLGISAAGLVARRLQVPIRFAPRDESVREMFRLSIPVYIGNGGARINGVITRAFASSLAAGSVSALYYALYMVDTLVEGFSQSVTRALFPFFAQEFASNGSMSNSLRRSIVSASIVLLPVSVGAVVLSRPLIQLLLQRGAFDAASTEMTVQAFRVYAPALCVMVVSDILAAAYYAQRNTASPVKVGLARVAVTALGCAALVPVLGHVGIAAAQCTGQIFKGVMLMKLLGREDDRRALRDALAPLSKLAIAALGMGALVTLTALTIAPIAGPGARGHVVVLLSGAIAGASAYFLAVRRLCPDEVSYCVRAVRGVIPRRWRLRWE